ncbi:MAG: DUF4372 domain-containing protein [Chlorobi bacterium]|nr:DUF4372 domain-containing protein [Chlorobiota bacterium]
MNQFQSDKGCSTYKVYDQFVSMTFGQLNKCLSLREINLVVKKAYTIEQKVLKPYHKIPAFPKDKLSGFSKILNPVFNGLRSDKCSNKTKNYKSTSIASSTNELSNSFK